jgi:hypothetical protein
MLLLIFVFAAVCQAKELRYCSSDTLDKSTYLALPPGARLLTTQVLVRHGERTPSNVVLKDQEDVWDCEHEGEFLSDKGELMKPAGMVSNGTCEIGQLTFHGMS